MGLNDLINTLCFQKQILCFLKVVIHLFLLDVLATLYESEFLFHISRL